MFVEKVQIRKTSTYDKNVEHVAYRPKPKQEDKDIFSKTNRC